MARHYRFQFLRNAARVSEVGDDEAGHAGEQRDCLSNISVFRHVEIEQDWQVIVLSKLLSEVVEDGFTFLRKAAQDQHPFRGNRVNDVANFFVVEQQVDELSNFDVVYSDSGFSWRSNDQIFL